MNVVQSFVKFMVLIDESPVGAFYLKEHAELLYQALLDERPDLQVTIVSCTYIGDDRGTS